MLRQRPRKERVGGFDLRAWEDSGGLEVTGSKEWDMVALRKSEKSLSCSKGLVKYFEPLWKTTESAFLHQD